jgi:hypothetical protein
VALVSDPPHRGRGKTIVSLIFFLVIVAKQGDQPAESGLAGFVSTFRVIPEVAGELAQALSDLLNSGSR